MNVCTAKIAQAHSCNVLAENTYTIMQHAFALSLMTWIISANVAAHAQAFPALKPLSFLPLKKMA
jgi:hypothetical protein